MKVSNYLKNIFSIFGGNPLIWIIFGSLLLLHWKIAILSWIIPALTFIVLGRKKEKNRDDWEIILTPIVNFIVFSVILTGFVIKCFEKLKSIVLRF